MSTKAEQATRSGRPDRWRFFLYSGIGIFAFFIPFPFRGKTTILLDHVVGAIDDWLGDANRFVAYAIILAGAVYPLVTGRWKTSLARGVFAALNVFGLVVATALVFHIGPAWVHREDLGPFLYDHLVIPVGVLVPVGSIFLAMLVGFGLMEFIGVFVQGIMRPTYRVPGRAAVDAVASFVGSYSLGLLITNRVYKAGGYTAREAAIIAGCFSTASVTFMVVIARTLGLMPLWGPYFGATFIITFVVSAILVHVPPLSRIPDEYFEGAHPRPEEKVTSHRVARAWEQADEVLARCPSLAKVLWYNLRDGIVMTMQILPGIMSVGFIGLSLALYTPVFEWLGWVFWPFNVLFRVPDPTLASEAMAIGLAELFLPATLVTAATSEALRFIIAVVSISQIFFFSSMIPAVLGTEIPLKIWHMVVMWFQRIVLTIPLAVLAAALFTSW
ncbi:YjiH family protein [Corynebacterium uberis]|uniref:YjiH family protein n=1 Tax=Corynebacterium TaxID=1716 RepID=UPI001D0B80DF|nr:MULTISPECIES: YjiH family protein [Corynebacterium]MCZ9310010.1 YjiH family protein [Corynebacterium sp. c6VSa_13]UDL73760.1 YjiH family protein [Corynebacterium uberis]UDL77568.1 YjiH family protein [Corynebacterium uberis]UDL81986.1 YjiH family protein [Corynebacterium uberis]UDL84194.1 YjiH family protein [Corynebacterium uberis]